ncbi:MAG: hypothetical protein RID07_12450, partial [Lacipirellulaceae bacterium]
LDPRSLQMLMMCGGGLLVLGLIVWLWSIGVFANSLVVACIMGGANLAVLGVGAMLVRESRYQTAGRAVTLLACLVLPLNLWFYNAQGLITLSQGGHLWFPALVICCLYAGIARILKDPLFVYTFVGGVTMTGLLFLADQRVDRFWEVISPSMLLVVIGVICVHTERLFSSGKGPFSRENFGAAFFRAGHVAMGAGLAVLLGGRIAGRLYEPFFAGLNWFDIPTVATTANLKLFALVIAAIGAYTYFYSIAVAGRGKRYAYSAILMLLWCVVIGIDLLAIRLTGELMIGLLAAIALAANTFAIASLKLRPTGEAASQAENANDTANTIASTGGILGLTLSVFALALGGWYFAGEVLNNGLLEQIEFDWQYLPAMLTLAMATSVGATLQSRLGRERSETLSRGIVAIAVAISVVASLSLLGVGTLAVQLPILGLLPLFLLLVSRGSGEESSKNSLQAMARSSLTVLFLTGIVGTLLTQFATIFGFRGHETGGMFNLLQGLFFAESANAFAVLTKSNQKSGRSFDSLLVAGSCWAAAWHLLVFCGLVTYAPILAASVVGVLCLIADRVLGSHEVQPVSDQHLSPHRSDSTKSGLAWAGYLMTTLGGIAGGLLTFNRFIGGDQSWELLALMVGQAIAAIAAGVFAPSPDARRGLFTLAGVHALLGILIVNALSTLSFGQRAEIFVTAGGMILLAFGHTGWRRELAKSSTEGERSGRSQAESIVSFNLSLGSVLTTAPLVLGLLSQRIFGSSSGWAWVMVHEVGVLALGLILLGLGTVCRIRSTTLAGGTSLVIYVLSLLTLIHLPEQLQ